MPNDIGLLLPDSVVTDTVNEPSETEYQKVPEFTKTINSSSEATRQT